MWRDHFWARMDCFQVCFLTGSFSLSFYFCQARLAYLYYSFTFCKGWLLPVCCFPPHHCLFYQEASGHQEVWHYSHRWVNSCFSFLLPPWLILVFLFLSFSCNPGAGRMNQIGWLLIVVFSAHPPWLILVFLLFFCQSRQIGNHTCM